ncbi:DUF4192 domain-containing protein [Nocardioides humilatus]|uniref:DUF4192 domain-containing protein n=1 Tax=Nocardioides humilatus TaxID=2607660 RepID=A0A5B1L9G8_9ACTN|nr:DUF4192 domain-containing protein [Nocardioides humilatus]KAA1416307.1 DUF4192 domain-containing protein [Nocardioides humilatus]
MNSTPTSTPTSTPMTLRARCADDLIAAAPLVLGFHPTHSVMIMTSDGDRPFHARTDLPGAPAPVEDQRAVAAMLVDAARRNGVRSLAVLLYGGERATRPTWQALRRACRQSRLQIVAALRVDDRRYFPLLGDRAAREIGIAYDISAHPFLAEAMFRGMVIQPDRASLATTLAPDAVAQAAVQAMLDDRPVPRMATPGERSDQVAWLSGFVSTFVSGGQRPSDEDVARALWLVQDVRLRDHAWALVLRDNASRHQELWLDVVRRSPDRYLPAPAVLLAWAAYRAGNGAMAWLAIDRCQTVDPDHRLADLLARCLDGALPPDAFDDHADDHLEREEGLPA